MRPPSSDSRRTPRPRYGRICEAFAKTTLSGQSWLGQGTAFGWQKISSISWTKRTSPHVSPPSVLTAAATLPLGCWLRMSMSSEPSARSMRVASWVAADSVSRVRESIRRPSNTRPSLGDAPRFQVCPPSSE